MAAANSRAGGFRSRAEKRGLFVQHDVNGEMREQFLEFFLFAEGAKKRAVLQLGQNLGSDAAGDEDAAAREGLERQVAGLGAIQRDEEIERFDAYGTGTLETQARDFRRGIRSRLIESWR